MDTKETECKDEGYEEKPEVTASKEEKNDKLKRLLDEEHKRAEQYLNQLKYLQADFDNYCKQSKKWTDQKIKFANELLVTKLLDVFDTLELAIKAARQANNKEALVKGIEITLKNFKDILKDSGVEKIEALGKEFDPNYHEALEQVVTKDPPDNIVVEELRKGYLFRGKVIRPTMVKVTKLLPVDKNLEKKGDDMKNE